MNEKKGAAGKQRQEAQSYRIISDQSFSSSPLLHFLRRPTLASFCAAFPHFDHNNFFAAGPHPQNRNK
jgi:hypothetical protein